MLPLNIYSRYYDEEILNFYTLEKLNRESSLRNKNQRMSNSVRSTVVSQSNYNR